MVFVLLLLAAGFTVGTLKKQPDQSDSAIARLLDTVSPADAVLLAGSNSVDDSDFIDRLSAEAARRHVQVRAVVRDPRAAYAKLDEIAGAKPDRLVVLASGEAAAWLVFESMVEDHPGIVTAEVRSPGQVTRSAFLQRKNLINVASQIGVIAIVAIGMTLVVIAGSIDLSVGSLIAFAAVLTCLCVRDLAGAEHATALGMTLSAGIAMLACTVLGAVNGVVSSVWRVPPFVVTLAMMMIASGSAYLMSAHQSVYQVPASFTWLGRGELAGGIPVSVALMVLLYVLAHLFMKHTAMGRHLLAVGGNREAAILSGVSPGRVLVFAHAVCGFFAGLGGVVMASNLKAGSATYGVTYEMYVIAAVVVGGTSLSGGRGRIFGTLTGAFIIAVIQNGMNLMELESETQKMVLGGVILLVVILDSLRRP